MGAIKSRPVGQMRLPLGAPKTWGGARKGAGRKPRGRPCVPHVTRPKIDPRYPVQVTIRARPGLPSLRSPRLFGAIQRAIARASVDGFRVIHFSIQQDHGHFIVEGDKPRRARGGMHGLAIRLALAVNRVLGRKGKVVGDRRGPLSRAGADHAAPNADQHGLRASQLPEAPPGASLHRPAQLGSALFGVAATTRRHRCRCAYRAAHHLDGARGGATRAGPCGLKNSRPARASWLPRPT